MQVAGRTISKYSVALLVIVLTGLFLRVYQLGTQSIWDDEAFSVWISQLSLSQIVQTTATDVHPPLFYFILHYWIALFGTSEFAVRSLSVLFGVLAIPAVYVLGRRLFDKEVGLLAALILALSEFNIQYSQETRMYSLIVLLTVLSMYFLIRFLQRSTIVIAIGYVVSTTLLLYTHVYGLFVVIGQNVYLLTLFLLSRERAFRFRHWVLLQLLLVALFAPWISVLLSQILKRQNALPATVVPNPPINPTLKELAYTFARYAGTTVPATYYSTAALVLLFLALSVISFFTYRKVLGSMDWRAPLSSLRSYAWEVRFTKDYDALYLLLVWLLAINIIPFVISLFSSPIYWFRYTIAASAALYLIVAKGIMHINHRYAKVAIVIVIVTLSAANLQTYYTTPSKPQAREAAEFIQENAQTGDSVLLFPGASQFVFNSYYWFLVPAGVGRFPLSSIGQGLASNIKELQSDVNGHNLVWLIVEMPPAMPGIWDPQVLNQTIQTLNNASYNETYHNSYYGYDVYLFVKLSPSGATNVTVPGAASGTTFPAPQSAQCSTAACCSSSLDQPPLAYPQSEATILSGGALMRSMR